VWAASRAKRRGRHCDRLALGTNSQRCQPTRRLLTAMVLFFFGCQLGRFYLATSADRHLCPEQWPEAVAGLHGGHDHYAVQGITPPHPEGGPYFQHCKEYAYGLGLTPVQPLAEPVVLSFPWVQSVSVALLSILLPFPQNDLTTPFHPPRHLS